MTKFWMVYNNTTGNVSRVKHYEKDKAVKEAERLARANPGQDFIVLEAGTSYQVKEQPVTATPLQEPVRCAHTAWTPGYIVASKGYDPLFSTLF